MSASVRMKKGTMVTIVVSLLFLASFFVLGSFLEAKNVSGQAIITSNVTARINVTNTEPFVFQVAVDDSIESPADEIDLAAGSTREVICNASVSDVNGFDDINYSSAIFFDESQGPNGDADNNERYLNNSCTECSAVAGDTNNASCVCRFNVEYYANNGSWSCQMTVFDTGGSQLDGSKIILNDSANSSTTNINGLLAIATFQTEIDYGNLSVTQTSDPTQVLNISNGGNIQTNFTLSGFGTENDTATNRNWSFVCTTGNISVGYHRYSNVSDDNWEDMINLSGSPDVYRNITLNQRTNDSYPIIGNDSTSTYWRVKIPFGIGGLCNGTIQIGSTSDAS